MNNDIVFLVEGHLEQKFIQNICPKKIVRRLQCNGSEVKPAAIAKRITSQCNLLRGRYRYFIVIIDKEDRNCSPSEFEQQIQEELRKNNNTENVIIGVPDRMIENWILADINTVNRYCNPPIPANSSFEGENGKSILSQHMNRYHSTTIGVEMLHKCNPSSMKNSHSFSIFFEKITQTIDCWWFKK